MSHVNLKTTGVDCYTYKSEYIESMSLIRSILSMQYMHDHIDLAITADDINTSLLQFLQHVESLCEPRLLQTFEQL